MISVERTILDLYDSFSATIIQNKNNHDKISRMCIGRKFDDGVIGYVEVFVYSDGTIEYHEQVNPKLEDGSYTMRNVRRFRDINEVRSKLA